MAQTAQQKAAAYFAKQWNGKGDEKQETQRFWIGLLHNVLGVSDAENYIEFEKRVKLSHTSFIDAYIPETKVLIEQKGSKIDLHRAYEQSDGSVLTPFEQAKRYVGEMKASEKPRWIVVCNFQEFLVYDLEKPHSEPEQILLKDFGKEFYRLQFLVNQKNENLRKEEEVSLAAGVLVGKLYDALFKEYINPDEKSFRSLNILCVRIVFCLYAEDAGLFETRTAFEDYIKSFSLENLRKGLIDLFKALDTKLSERDKYDLKLKPFPYVNGGLFAEEDIEIPNFTQEIVDVIVERCAPFNWRDISPTIFGAVFESTLNPETRWHGGMHYTSIANIHKVIDPLFMDDLTAELDAILASAVRQRSQRLLEFQKKLGSLTFLDPACGSGNFLTETYLCLRRLENRVISALNNGEKVLGLDTFIHVKINQFYGIEINDFAVTVAKTALWIAESQMVAETETILCQNIDFLPLTTSANIVEANALRIDWSTLSEELPVNFLYTDKLNVYKVENETFSAVHEPEPPYGKHYKELNVVAKEVEEKKFPPQTEKHPVVYDYIIGNPPFLGARWMEPQQKEDVILTFGKNWQGVGDLDYVSCWYKKAFTTISGQKTRCAFVSTNSITQGCAVANLWKPMIDGGLHIDFAWRTFKWSNDTPEKSGMAAVHCVIVGFSVCQNAKPKVIYINEKEKVVASNINGYLIDAPNIFAESRQHPLCDVPEIGIGNKPIDGGNYLFAEEEKVEFLRKEPKAEKYFRKWIGSDEFINRWHRWCLWLGDCTPAEIKQMPECYKRVQAVRELRLASKSAPTQKLADKPTRFHVENFPTSNYILVPEVSSERRFYVPMGFLTPDIFCSNLVKIIPNATLYHFGVLTSLVHMAWMRVVCGRLKSDYRYSKDIVYNNFPWPSADEKQQKAIEHTAQKILDARAIYPDSSFGDLYDETLMPHELRKAHRENDKAVMQAYGFDLKMTEGEIVAELFKMYEKLKG